MLKARLDLRQSQNLVMTPQLQQAIKLLQFSNAELSDYIDQELMQNPLLEAGERDPKFVDTTDEAIGNGAVGLDDRIAALPEVGEAGEVSSAAEMARSEHLASDRDAPLDAAPESLYDGEGEISANGAPTAAEFSMASLGTGGAVRGGSDFDDPNLEETLSEASELRDRLEQQLQLEISDPAERLIGAYLIDMMDEAGYLRDSLAEIGRSARHRSGPG